MYRKILVPMDGSGFSEVSIKHAKTLALGCSAKEIVLLGVVAPIPDSAWVAPDERAEAAKKAESWITDYLSKVAEGLKKDNVSTKAVIVKGDPASEILDYAKNHDDIDLIIMATHGDSGVVRWLVGSVSERVVLHSTVPVMSIPPKSR
jgi:nucleotide-binding universal stress UspA family protein